jgi:hypothetical protein
MALGYETQFLDFMNLLFLWHKIVNSYSWGFYLNPYHLQMGKPTLALYVVG